MKIACLFLLIALQSNAAVIRVNQYKFPSGSTLNDSLVSHWSMEESSGTRVDSEPTGTAQNLTDNNTVTLASGIQGNAAFFVAANNESLSHVDSADLSVGDIDFSLAVWVKITALDLSMSVASHYSSAGNQRAWDMRFNATSGKFDWIVSNDGVTLNTREMTSFGTPATNTWIFWYVEHDSVGNTIAGSVNDGTVNSVAHTTGVLNSSANFVVGANGFGVFYFDGSIDELSFWKRKLTAAEITELYAAGASKFCCPY